MPVNPKLYRELSDPFESAKEAQAAWNAFFEDLGEIRKKHGFQNIHVIALDSYITDGEEGAFMINAHYGDSSQAEAMAAYAFGVEKAQREEVLAKLLKRKPKTQG
jgi:hypothetical protein